MKEGKIKEGKLGGGFRWRRGEGDVDFIFTKKARNPGRIEAAPLPLMNGEVFEAVLLSELDEAILLFLGFRFVPGAGPRQDEGFFGGFRNDGDLLVRRFRGTFKFLGEDKLHF